MSITYVSPEVSSMIEDWNFISDVRGGWKSVKKAKEAYLPKEQNEGTESYDARHSRGTYFDEFNPTIDGLTGLLFKKPIMLSDDVPDEIAQQLENADTLGNHFDIIIAKYFAEALSKGISYVYVDMPYKDETIKSRADEINNGIRPYITIINPENVTSWKTEVVNGNQILSQVKIREFSQEDDPENPYKTVTVEKYRVLEIGYWSLYSVKDGVETLEAEGTTGKSYIPLVPLNLNQKGFLLTTPPFYELAQLNISQYQVFCDSRNNAHIASVPFYVATGADKEELENLVISPNTLVALSDSDADVKIVDYEGKGVEANNLILDPIKLKMREIGLSAVTESNNLTAFEVNISTTQKQSKLNLWTRLLIDSVEVILAMWADMNGNGYDNGGSIEIDADILSAPLTAEQFTALSNMNAKGQMSVETMFNMIGNGKMELPSDFDIDLEKERVLSEGLGINDKSVTI